MSQRERKLRESPLREVEISSIEASEVEEKLGTFRKRRKMRFEHAYFEMNRPDIAPRTRVGRGEPSYTSRIWPKIKARIGTRERYYQLSFGFSLASPRASAEPRGCPYRVAGFKIVPIYKLTPPIHLAQGLESVLPNIRNMSTPSNPESMPLIKMVFCLSAGDKTDDSPHLMGVREQVVYSESLKA
ncbi:hypothetical protein K438DRAFT_1748420 [Mycena galopus ATCC 62051]|nr:hypothetical protein K438DRAFT_1748420 [Mycena galopus ATCC 62051]